LNILIEFEMKSNQSELQKK